VEAVLSEPLDAKSIQSVTADTSLFGSPDSLPTFVQSPALRTAFSGIRTAIMTTCDQVTPLEQSRTSLVKSLSYVHANRVVLVFAQLRSGRSRGANLTEQLSTLQQHSLGLQAENAELRREGVEVSLLFCAIK